MSDSLPCLNLVIREPGYDVFLIRLSALIYPRCASPASKPAQAFPVDRACAVQVGKAGPSSVRARLDEFVVLSTWALVTPF